MKQLAIRPIRKKRLFEEIILAIEEYVRDNKISPGEKLPSESSLAAMFDVSKTAIREAMSVLHINGIVETRSGSGTFLKEVQNGILDNIIQGLINKDELVEILEFRRGLEVEASALAAMKATTKDLEVIETAHNSLIEVNKSGLMGVHEDFLFHYSIVLASHNSLYINVFDSLASKIKEEIRISKMQSAKISGRYSVIHKEHTDIFEAIKNENFEKASFAMRQHLVSTEKKIWEHMH